MAYHNRYTNMTTLESKSQGGPLEIKEVVYDGLSGVGG